MKTLKLLAVLLLLSVCGWPQTHTFCPEDGACVWTGTNTFPNVNGVLALDGTKYPFTQAGLVAAMAAACTSNTRKIFIHGDVLSVASTIAIPCAGIELDGSRGDRAQSAGGTVIEFSGTGALFQNGTDDGLGWDKQSYNGQQGFIMRDILMRVAVAQRTSTTPNGLATYLAGSYAIQDWRGGGFQLYNVTMEFFDYSFFGVQSDFDIFDNVNVNYSRHGIYMGPWSDQADFRSVSGISNETMLWLQGAHHFVCHRCQWDFSGSASNDALIIGSFPGATVHVASSDIELEDNWFERGIFTGSSASVPDAFINFGVGDTYQSFNLHIVRPAFVNAATGNANNVKYLVTTGNVDGVQVEAAGSNSASSAEPEPNLVSWFNTTGNSSPHLDVKNMDKGGQIIPLNTPTDSGTVYGSAIRRTTSNWGVGGYRFEGILHEFANLDDNANGVAVSLHAGKTVDKPGCIKFTKFDLSTTYYTECISSDGAGVFSIDDNLGLQRFLLTSSETRLQIPTSGTMTIRDHNGATKASITEAGLATFNGGVAIPGATSGTATIQAAAIAGTPTLTLPSATGTLANVIASGTSTFTTTAVGAGACQTTVTTAATNALTSDTISWAYASAPTAATDGVLHIQPYVTANNVNFMRCNPTAGSITPTALVINWRVIR